MMLRRCLLNELNDHKARSPFMGLVKSEWQAEANRSWFSCCDGTGRQITATGIKLCPLTQRIAKLQAVLDLYQRRWGVGHKKFLYSVLDRVDLQKLVAISNGAQVGGRLLTSKDNTTPGSLWSLAIAAAWRFDHQVHFVTMHAESKDSLLPTRHLPNTVMLVENHQPPWHPDTMLDCEAIVNYCYNTSTPLWFDFVREKKPATPTVVNATLVSLQRRVARLKQGSPLPYFSPEGRAKLQEMQMV